MSDPMYGPITEAYTPSDVDPDYWHAVDLFAGPGGWDEGVRMAFPAVRVLGFEFDPDACATAMAAGHPRICADVRDIDPMTYANIRMLIASPPCQGFSMAGKGLGRADAPYVLAALAAGEHEGIAVHDIEAFIASLEPHMADDKTLLALVPFVWAVRIRPQFVVWEQVPPVLKLWEALAVLLRAEGYEVVTGLVHSEQYGVPQTRKRAVLLARLVRDEDDVEPLALPTPTHSKYHSRDPQRLDDGVLPWVSMAEALGFGMTERPYPTVVVGTASGGIDPQCVGGTGARKIIADAREGGRWRQRSNYSGAGTTPGATAAERGRTTRDLDQPSVAVTGKGFQWEATDEVEYVNGTGANASRRTTDKPAPTVHFGARVNGVSWAMRSRNSVAGQGRAERDVETPAVTITGAPHEWAGTPIERDGEQLPRHDAELVEAGTWPNNGPATTVTGDPRVFAPGGHHQPGEQSRHAIRVSPVEAAILQSFPADYPFQGRTKGSMYQQIGNAVPPLLAAACIAAVVSAR